MARHKERPEPEEPESGMDISSLIDVCFLLLIYFLVATSIVQEKKVDMQMPSSASASAKKPDLEPAFIKIDTAGIVYWGSDGPGQIVIESDPNQRELNQLFEKLDELRQTAEGISKDTKPVVQLWVEGGVKNQRLVDVMNALTKAKIKTVGLSNVKEDE